MKQITDIKELKPGDRIVRFDGERADQWEFLMIHPHNDKYVLLLDKLTQNAFKEYIPNILNNDKWQMECSIQDVIEHELTYHKEQVRIIQKSLSKIKD